MQLPQSKNNHTKKEDHPKGGLLFGGLEEIRLRSRPYSGRLLRLPPVFELVAHPATGRVGF
jgi:hypothetical protein